MASIHWSRQCGGSLSAVRLPFPLPQKAGQRHLIAPAKHHRAQRGVPSPRSYAERLLVETPERASASSSVILRCSRSHLSCTPKSRRSASPAFHPDVPLSTSLCTLFMSVWHSQASVSTTGYWIPVSLSTCEKLKYSAFLLRRSSDRRQNECSSFPAAKAKFILTFHAVCGIVPIPVKRGFLSYAFLRCNAARPPPRTRNTGEAIAGSHRNVSAQLRLCLSPLDSASVRIRRFSSMWIQSGGLPPQNTKEVPNLWQAKYSARIKITLRCSECKQRNYNTMKNKKNTLTVWSSTSTAPSAESTPSTMRRSNSSGMAGKERRVTKMAENEKVEQSVSSAPKADKAKKDKQVRKSPSPASLPASAVGSGN